MRRKDVLKTGLVSLTNEGAINPLDLDWKGLVNTEYFKEAAIHFEKYGVYTDAPKGTKPYDDYWKQQTLRCLNGYEVGGWWIPGEYYFFLNFCPMAINVKENSIGRKKKGFPRFMSIQYRWFISKFLARANSKHLAVLKTRRAGFSYAEAADTVYQYNFFPLSKSYIYAYHEQALFGDAIWEKIQDIVDHLNEYTAWYKNRHEVDRRGHYKASYKETKTTLTGGNKTLIKGFKSEIILQAIKDPSKVRGGGASKVSFEEAGSFPNLETAWSIAEPMVKEGEITTGIMTAFGTGGEEKDEGLISLENIFYDPITYNTLPFKNIWETNYDTCGFFVPCTDTTHSAYNNNGTLNYKKAEEFHQTERRKKKGRALTKHCAEFPFTPSEALTRMGTTLFPVYLVANHRPVAEAAQSQIQKVFLAYQNESYKDGNEIKIRKQVKRLPVDQNYLNTYPLNAKDIEEKDAPICIVQNPTGHSIYYIVLDPYAKDGVKVGEESLGAAYVMRRPNTSHYDNQPDDCIVAWYVTRPATRFRMFKQVIMLSEYYNNAKIVTEIRGGGQSFIDYCRQEEKLHLLEEKSSIIRNKAYQQKSANIEYGIYVTNDDDFIWKQELAEWLETPISVDVKGNKKYNIDNILDLGLLDEFKKYNDDGNFDRISSLRLIIPYRKKILLEQQINSKEESDNFFNKPLYTNYGYSSRKLET